MGRQTQHNTGNPVHRDEKLQGSPISTAAAAAAAALSSPSTAPVVTTAVSATLSATTPPAPRPALDLAPDALVQQTRKGFSDLPAELREELAEWLDEAGATKSLLNLSVVEKKMRECLAMKNHRTEVWFHKGKQQRFKWWYAEESPQIRSIRHLVMVIKPTFDNRQLPHEIGGHVDDLIPCLKSFAKWTRYDKDTAKWTNTRTLTLVLYTPHQPSDFFRTLRSLGHAPPTNTKKSGLKGASLTVRVHGRDQRENEFKETREFFPNQGYRLRDVVMKPSEDRKGFPTSAIAQFGGALSFENWETSLVICDFVKWGEEGKCKLIASVHDMISIDSRSCCTNVVFRMPCRDWKGLPTEMAVKNQIMKVLEKWIDAVFDVPRTVSLAFEVYDPNGNTSVAKLSCVNRFLSLDGDRTPAQGRRR